MANVLLLGGGGREHALACKLAQSSRVAQIFVVTSNAGIRRVEKAVPVDLKVVAPQFAEVIAFCKDKDVGMVVAGPEALLVDGIADALAAASICCPGPRRLAARIEADKAYAKDFMAKVGIPAAKSESFTESAAARAYIESAAGEPLVVKASGLAAGKGVVVCASRAEAVEAARQMLEDETMGDAGKTVVVEQLLRGREASVLCFTDGECVRPMPVAHDYKRVGDGDAGANTGGMGAFAPSPFVDSDTLDFIQREVLQKAVDGLKADGIRYTGVLYAGVMLTDDGPKVLEFNCRFGDPETQVLLPLLDADLYEVMLACCDGSLASREIRWRSDVTACGVVVASREYPAKCTLGHRITGLDQLAAQGDMSVFHAGTRQEGAEVLTNGGRVVTVVCVAPTTKAAVQGARSGAARVCFSGAQFRNDIGQCAIGANGLTYASAGVDIEAGSRLVKDIRALCSSTRRRGCVDEIGGFGAAFDLKEAGFDEPILVMGADGVGTKLAVAAATDRWDTVGVDLVAMCANDVLCHGAEPLAFLDYVATGRLDVQRAAAVVAGVARGCRLAGCTLAGGETAELPRLYEDDQIDIGGFVVGAVERKHPRLPLKSLMAEGDSVLGLASSGLHSNGYSLVRQIVDSLALNFASACPWRPSATLGDELLTPTKIYVSTALLSLARAGKVKGIAHITGGGLLENVPRVLPPHLKVVLDAETWPINEAGPVDADEMARTFNCGVGLVLIVDSNHENEVLDELRKIDESVYRIGQLHWRNDGEKAVQLLNLDRALRPKAEHCENGFGHVNGVATKKKRVGILISGSGSNMVALIQQSLKPNSHCNVVVVISNKANASGLDKARRLGIPTRVVAHADFGGSRARFETALDAALRAEGVELVCLAGFMRILTDDGFVNGWLGRLLNVHPSLLPAFPGMHAVKQALAARATVTGSTVHFVQSGTEVDGGPPIAQSFVLVQAADTEATLTERVKAEEHRLYPAVMEAVARGAVQMKSCSC